MLRRAALLLTALLAAACGDGRPPAVGDGEYHPPDGDALDVVRAPDSGFRTTPYPAADFTLELPYRGPEQRVNFTLTARPGHVDVHLCIDTTGSFGGEIRELQSALETTVIPRLRSQIPSLSLGVSRFEDMPFEPFGSATDLPFELLLAQTTQTSLAASAVARLDNPLGDGGDVPEAWAEALYQIATGEGLRTASRVLVPARASPHSTAGGVGFRADATRAVVLVTDASTHEATDYRGVVPGAHSLADALAALQANTVHVVGIASGTPARAGLEAVAQATGAVVPAVNNVCRTGIDGGTRPATSGGCPLVYDIAADGTGLSRTIVDGISQLLATVAYREVHGRADDDAHGFVSAIEAASAAPPAGVATPQREDRVPSGARDGVLDTFVNVYPSIELSFALRVRNTSVASTEFPQVFFIPIVVLGDGVVLRELLLRVIVPEGPKFDAGLGAQDGSATDVPDAPHAATDAAESADGDGAALQPADVAPEAGGETGTGPVVFDADTTGDSGSDGTN